MVMRISSPRKRKTSPKKRKTSPRKRRMSPKKRKTSPRKRRMSPRKRKTSPRKVTRKRRMNGRFDDFVRAMRRNTFGVTSYPANHPPPSADYEVVTRRRREAAARAGIPIPRGGVAPTGGGQRQTGGLTDAQRSAYDDGKGEFRRSGVYSFDTDVDFRDFSAIGAVSEQEFKQLRENYERMMVETGNKYGAIQQGSDIKQKKKNRKAKKYKQLKKSKDEGVPLEFFIDEMRDCTTYINDLRADITGNLQRITQAKTNWESLKSPTNKNTYFHALVEDLRFDPERKKEELYSLEGDRLAYSKIIAEFPPPSYFSAALTNIGHGIGGVINYIRESPIIFSVLTNILAMTGFAIMFGTGTDGTPTGLITDASGQPVPLNQINIILSQISSDVGTYVEEACRQLEISSSWLSAAGLTTIFTSFIMPFLIQFMASSSVGEDPLQIGSVPGGVNATVYDPPLGNFYP